MSGNHKPLIVLDDDLSTYKECLKALGFKVIFLKDPVRSEYYPNGISGDLENTEGLRNILSGRVLLSSKPDRFQHLQIIVNFDLVVIPTDADPGVMTQIISKEVEQRDLWKHQACWRLDIDHSGKVLFRKLEED